MHRSKLALTIVPLLGAWLLSACSTPRHTNTLIFGTNTKFAFDVSQEATGAVGVTLGYKRQEAVWMPLLANQAGTDGRLVPTVCTPGEACKFAGTAGKGGAAGENAVDTYSVLATFSGQAKGGAGAAAEGPNANGSLAQYFATGFAARLLAEKGGAALVNTASTQASEIVVREAVRDANAAKIKGENARIGEIVRHVTAADGSLDATKLGKLTTDAKLSNGDKRAIDAMKSPEALSTYLEATYDANGQPLFDAIQ
jgi:hypothetical protein